MLRTLDWHHKKTRQGNTPAKFYLIAVIAFFIIDGIAISQSQLSVTNTIKLEHIALLAVDVEIILLALVLSYQFAFCNIKMKVSAKTAS